jgi:hypothetical protein
MEDLKMGRLWLIFTIFQVTRRDNCNLLVSSKVAKSVIFTYPGPLLRITLMETCNCAINGFFCIVLELFSRCWFAVLC